MHLARLEVSHPERFFRGFAGGGERRSIFLLEREVVSRETVSEQPDQLRLINAVFVEIPARDQHQSCAAVGDLRTIGHFQRRSDARVLVRDLRRAVVSQVGLPHLRERIQPRVSVVFVRHPGEVLLGSAIFFDVNLRDLSEQFREHEVAVFRLLDMIISRRAEHIRTVE